MVVLATGSMHSYFGNDQWGDVAPGLKTIEDATEMRRRVLIAFEAAEREADPARRRAWITFVVVGGGPTGAELAGALGGSRTILEEGLRRIRPPDARLPRRGPTDPACSWRPLEKASASCRACGGQDAH
jgi:NADH dehydrogenase